MTHSITAATGQGFDSTMGVDRNTAASNHSKWAVRIISDKVKGASRPAARQANVAFRADVLPLAGDFRSGSWLRVSEPGTGHVEMAKEAGRALGLSFPCNAVDSVCPAQSLFPFPPSFDGKDRAM